MSEQNSRVMIGSGSLWYKKTKDHRTYLSGFIFEELPDKSLRKLHIKVFMNDYKLSGNFFKCKEKTPDCSVVLEPFIELKKEAETSSVPFKKE